MGCAVFHPSQNSRGFSYYVVGGGTIWTWLKSQGKGKGLELVASLGVWGIKNYVWLHY